ncbi:glycoside hydrolase family 76 protein [Lentithecium fluviatile CBS 122367]|uniref:Glycoside hydrolase family 76 protein n=1 Tax=Lentithecium fluviatile CBS 122367 TaxID=1168545 RepID=A0A6G1ILE5_9PLEO|nr:glycoside hydrolase family 76 protein [Lentithecium fluviatile CBS 122367]
MHIGMGRWMRLPSVCLLLLALSTKIALATESDAGARSGIVQGAQHRNFLEYNPEQPSHQRPAQDAPPTATNVFQELHAALEVMQTVYFSLWLGKWTTAIDWTAAVMGTHLSATLSSLSRSLSYTMPGTFDMTRKLDVEAQMVENEINKYFGQSTAYYFGEDYFGIRNQAYDDILWVVLGWLESIQFIQAHSRSHHPPKGEGVDGKGDWHAQQFIPAFAHRARVFYELAEQGWDWRLCGGGMTWNPRLLPYKNAITNELFISASVGMYLHFPGDSNCSPFIDAHPNWVKLRVEELGDAPSCSDSASLPYDPIYLANAINGYDWLANSGMTNEHGLYVDGFHIKDYAHNHSKTECDERNEMVYTYNQGVVLSGLRGLWEATGNITYLEDGHELVRNVILATGWTKTNIARANGLAAQAVYKRKTKPRLGPMEGWSGLGAHGILAELCDPSGLCNQNGQTFKGIFFHHLTAFCTPLPAWPARPGKTHGASKMLARLHRRSCEQYAPWVTHNAQAALRTRDHRGRFGAWWGADSDAKVNQGNKKWYESLRTRGIDYRNDPVFSRPFPNEEESGDGESQTTPHDWEEYAQDDLNDRGRGRTVETQGSGVAVVRAMWEFLKRMGDEGDFDS